MSKDEDVGITEYTEETLIGLILKFMFLVITYILPSDMKGINSALDKWNLSCQQGRSHGEPKMHLIVFFFFN